MTRRALSVVVGAFLVFGLAGHGPLPVRADSGAPDAPTNLSVTVPGTHVVVPPGGWTRLTRVALHFDIHATADTGPVTPEVEVEPIGTPFTGTPNFSGAALNSSGNAVVQVSGLQNGTTYHWQARVTSSIGIQGGWMLPGSAKLDFGVDQDAPTRPTIHSPSNPNENRWYNARSVVLRWSAEDTLSGIRGYSYVLEHQAHVIPPGAISVQSLLRLNSLTDGVWFLAVRAVDRAGNWSPTATYRVLVDRQPPQLRLLSPARVTLNPYRGSTTVRFSVTKDASVRLSLYRVGSKVAVTSFSYPHLHAGQVTSVLLSGKDRHGKPLAKGYYFFSVQAIDRAQNILHSTLGGIVLDPEIGYHAVTGQVLYPNDGKRIIVSLSREALYAYDGVHLVVQTLVTTGNPNLPTPPGSYTVLGKYHPYEFISPWPPGSPYWYPPSMSSFAMLFREGGYFLHDAPWRSVFGPGSNGPGQPGSNFGGTHGCVNIPPGPMLTLWNWTDVGTRVDVVP